jgi:sulfur carrier protein
VPAKYEFEPSPSVEIIVNDQPQQVPDGSTVAQLLERLELSRRHVAVEVNRELVPRARHTEHRLAEGDRLEIVTLVGGG